MAEVLVMQNGDERTRPLSDDELRQEWRASQDEMLSMQAEMMQIADALWPDEHAERPADLDEEGATGDQLVAGIKSLHELTDRLSAENEHLRARLREQPAPPLRELDRALLLRELEAREKQLADLAERSFVHRAPTARAALLSRRADVRRLIALLGGAS